MSRRNKIILVIIFTVIFLLIIILIWWLLTRGKPQALTNKPANIEGQLQIPADLPMGGSQAIIDVSQPTSEQKLAAGLRAIAVTFAERFGSFSNQDSSSNLVSLSAISTARMKSFLEDHKESQAAAGGEQYYGVTTKSLLAEITDQNEDSGQAEVLVSAQRQESKGTTANPRVFYQDLVVKLVKVGDDWKVDFVEWGERK